MKEEIEAVSAAIAECIESGDNELQSTAKLIAAAAALVGRVKTFEEMNVAQMAHDMVGLAAMAGNAQERYLK